MPLKRSSFNPTLFGKNLTRFWPIWTLYSLIWLFTLPIELFVKHMNQLGRGGSLTYLYRMANKTILTLTADLGILLAFVFGVLAAMAVFSYLYNARAAGLMHTLPIRRGGLFLTSYLSGLTFLLGPHLLVALLTLATEAAAGVLNAWNVVLWFLIQSGMCFFFYTFAVFCAMFTGHILALPAFYGILNFLVLGVAGLLESLISMFTFGYDGGNFLVSLAQWFTPTLKLAGELYFRTVTENGVEVELFTGFQFVLLYMAAAVVLLLCAFAVYNRRQIETAGDVVSVRWARPIFKYGFAFCSALAGGMLLYYLLSAMFSSVVLPLTICMVVCGALGVLVAEMLLQKSFKVLSRSWRGALSIGLVVVVLMAGLSKDLFGLESWVPAPGDVKSVTVSLYSFPPYDDARGTTEDEMTDPAVITKAIAIHRAIVEDRAFLENYYDNRAVNDKDDGYDYLSFYISYHLINGSWSRRSYTVPIRVDNPAPAAGTLPALVLDYLNDPVRLEAAYFPYDKHNASPIQAVLPYYDTTTGTTKEAVLTSDQAAAVAEAVRTDLRAGRLGIHYLSDEDPQRLSNCSLHDLTISWLFTQANGDPFTFSVDITPQFSATELMSTLRELGILSDTRVLLDHQNRWNSGEDEAFGFLVNGQPVKTLPAGADVPWQFSGTEAATVTLID